MSMAAAIAASTRSFCANHAAANFARRAVLAPKLQATDPISPPAQGAALPAPTPASRTLYQNIVKLKLDVGQHVPTHGRVGTNDEFVKIFGKAATN